MRKRDGSLKRLLAAAAVLLAVRTTTTSPAKRGPDLPVIRPPRDLLSLDLTVQDQFRGLQARLDQQRRRRGSREDLGRAYGHFGMWYLNYRYRAAAETCLRAAARLAPRDDRWPFYLGQVYKREGRFRLARDAFEAVLALTPDDTAVLVHLGEVEQQQGDLAAARQHLMQAAELDPDAVRARVRLAEIDRTEGRLTAARDRLEQALRRMPFQPEIHYALGLTYRDLGDTARARWHLARGRSEKVSTPPIPMDDPRMRVLESYRADARAHDDLGRLAFQAGRYDEAVKEYAKAMAAAPKNLDLRHNHAVALLKAGRAQEALAEFQELLRVEPRFVDAHYAIGAILSGVNPARSERELRRALELDPRHVDAHEQLGRLLLRTGRPDEAARHFSVAVDLKPASSALRSWQIMSLVEAGRFEEAKQAARAGVEALPSRPELRLLLARVLATGPDAEQHADEALRIAKALFGSQPTLAVAETLAMAHAARRDYRAAAAWEQAGLDAARQAGRAGELPWLRQRLAAYSAGKTWQEPWAKGEPQAVTGRIRVRPPGSSPPTYTP